MRITIGRGALLKALNHVTSVVEKRTTIPILTHVLLIVEGDVLQLKATDLDIEIVETVAAEITAPGGCTVSAHMLHDIVRKLPEGAEITIATGKDDRLLLSAGKASFSLAALSRDDFPDLGASELPHSFALPAKALVKLIEKTRFAISTEETRYYLNGIFLHAIGSGEDGVLRAVATDGHRLAQIEVPLPGGAEGMPGVIVHRKAVAEILKIVADIDGDVQLELSPSKIRITTSAADGSPRVILTSKLIDGAFPDYGRVVPAGTDKVMQVLNSDFIRAVDRVSTLSAEKGRAVKLSISQDSLTLSVNNPDSGSAVEELPASYGDGPLEIGFNARYMLDIAAEIEGGHIIFILSDPSSPTIVKDEGNGAALYVLMPMRV